MSITLNIVAGDIADLKMQLARILGESELEPVYGSNTPEVFAPTAVAEPVDEQPKKSKRKPRRTKAQIAEDRDAEIANAVKFAEREPLGERKPSTKEDVSTAMGALLDAGQTGGDLMMGVLKALGALNEDGEPRLSALDEAKYGEAVSMMNTLLDEFKNAAAADPGIVLDQEIPS